MKDLKININMKSIMLFEKIANKSFYEMSEEDMPLFIYAIITVNNPQYKLTFNEFLNILNNKKMIINVSKRIEEELKYIQCLSEMGNDKNDNSDGKEDASKAKMTDIITMLILEYGIDSNYVMYDMQLWEILPFANAVERKTKSDMEKQRFWSYINILPHIDGKKVKGPEQLIPFPWEKDNKKKDNDDFIKNNQENIINFFKKQNYKEDE